MHVLIPHIIALPNNTPRECTTRSHASQASNQLLPESYIAVLQVRQRTILLVALLSGSAAYGLVVFEFLESYFGALASL